MVTQDVFGFQFRAPSNTSVQPSTPTSEKGRYKESHHPPYTLRDVICTDNINIHGIEPRSYFDVTGVCFSKVQTDLRVVIEVGSGDICMLRVGVDFYPEWVGVITIDISSLLLIEGIRLLTEALCYPLGHGCRLVDIAYYRSLLTR